MSDAAAGGNLYEAILKGMQAGTGGGQAPRMSAAVVPWRRGAPGAGCGTEVFWVKRGEGLAFMGGWHAFPGGGVARDDASLQVAEAAAVPRAAAAPEAEKRGREEAGGEGVAGGGQDSGAAGRQAGWQPDVAPGILACAIRELFEETGLLLARPAAAGPAPAAADLAAARRDLLAGKPFAAVLSGLGMEADASRLVYAGRWLTPPFAPLRFDNRFFLLEWPAAETLQPEVLPGELETGAWIDARAAWETWRGGDVLAAPPILHLLTVLAEDGPVTGLQRLRHPVEADLGPVRRVELRPGVLMFPLATATLPPAATTNAYLLGFGEAVLVDPGSADPAECDRLEEALAAARERLGRRVVAIWLTHHHPDHVAGVPELRRRLGVPVLAHALTAERLAPYAAQHGGLDGELADGQRVTLAGQGRPDAPDMEVLVVHTPGHARGHLCFLEMTQRSLLAGDMVAGLGTIVVDPPEGDMEDYLASLARLMALAPHTLFPGHGPAVKNAVPKLREYIDHRLWREQRVLDAWNDGRRDPAAMLPTVYDDVPREAHPLATRQILAHLARLRQGGRLSER
jgi:ribonuclease/clavin/mitogillin